MNNLPKHKKVQISILRRRNEEIEVLLFKTNKRRGEFWQNITGSVEEGESFVEAAIREIFEESQIKLNQEYLIDLNLSFKFFDRWNKEVDERSYAVIGTDLPDEIKIDPNEHCDFKWVNISKVNEDDYKFISNYQTLIEALKHV